MISVYCGIRQQVNDARGPVTQDHPPSRDNRAALTRCPIGGEVGADFCLLSVFRAWLRSVVAWRLPAFSALTMSKYLTLSL